MRAPAKLAARSVVVATLANCTMRERDTPLIDAARHGRVDDVVALVAGGADVNEPKTDNGVTALYTASHNGHTEVVTKLLAANARVDEAINDGATPLLIAC